MDNNLLKQNEYTIRTNSVNNHRNLNPKKPKQFTLKDLALYYTKISFKDLFK